MDQGHCEDADNCLIGHRICTVFGSEVCATFTKALHILDTFLKLYSICKLL